MNHTDWILTLGKKKQCPQLKPESPSVQAQTHHHFLPCWPSLGAAQRSCGLWWTRDVVLCHFSVPHSGATLPGDNQKKIPLSFSSFPSSFFFFCLLFKPFISPLTISFRLDSQSLWLWVQKRDEVMDWNELDGSGLSDRPGRKGRQYLRLFLLCRKTSESNKSQHIRSAYSEWRHRASVLYQFLF